MGVGLREYLLRQYKRGDLSAVEVCTISWRATRAGAVGVGDLAQRPDSRHQAEHLARTIATSMESKFYSMRLPAWCKDS